MRRNNFSPCMKCGKLTRGGFCKKCGPPMPAERQKKMSIVQPGRTNVEHTAHHGEMATPVMFSGQTPAGLHLHTLGGFTKREAIALHLIGARIAAEPDKWDGEKGTADIVNDCWEDARNIAKFFVSERPTADNEAREDLQHVETMRQAIQNAATKQNGEVATKEPSPIVLP